MRVLPALSLAGILATAAAPQASASEAILISGARVLDPDGGKWLEGRTLLVEGERITRIRAAAEAPEGARRIELRGGYLVPGLFDLHTHLLLHPYDETSWDDQVLREPLELRVIRATTAARATLEAGFTTIRDLGTEGAGLADVALRDAIATGLIPGPRLLASTRAIVATGCYGPSGFDRRWSVPQGAQEATGEAEVRKTVREQIAAGADWVKVYADYRRVKGDPASATFSLAELEALVDEAKSAGRPVVAHAVTSEGIRRAVLAGVKTIEHGNEASEEVLALMRERGVTLCPTLAATDAVARYAGWKGGEPVPAGVREQRETFARALRSGVAIACGSDAGVFRHGDNAHEIELMVEYGMTPGDALLAATARAARVLGREKDLGRIAEGYLADLVLVKDDPLRSASALRSPILVLKNGKVVLDRR